MKRKVWIRLSAIVVFVAIAVTVGGFLFFRVVQHKIASRLRPPPLQRESVPAPDFVYRTLDGGVLHLFALKGKVVFVNLWGTWCVQCVAEMPTVQKLYDHYRSDTEVEFVIVSRMDSPSSVRSYANRNHLRLPLYVAEDSDIPEAMHLNQYPSTFIYARDGSIAAQHAGAANWSDESVISFLDDLRSK